jgi:hypothetical protein
MRLYVLLKRGASPNGRTSAVSLLGARLMADSAIRSAIDALEPLKLLELLELLGNLFLS